MRRGLLALLAVCLVTSMVPLQVAASSTTTEEDPTFEGSAAAGWMTGARWDEVGLFTEIPNQVVYPTDSYVILETLEDRGASDRVDEEHPAWSVRRLQNANGGFLRFQGDSLGPWTDATAYALVFAQQTSADVYEDRAIEFLDARQNDDGQKDDGGFAPRVGATGSNLPSFMGATYDAVVGLQAADALNETTRSEVLSFLEDHQNDDGGWPTSMYNPDRSTMTGTWFAVRTLLTLDALDDETRRAAVDFVLSLEAATGGFAASNGPIKCGTVHCADIGEEVTTYSTSRAVQLLDTLDALDQASVSLVDHADWLANRQVTDGYYEGAFRSYKESPLPAQAPDTPETPGQPSPFEPFQPPVTHYSLTTSLALGALDSLEALDRADQQAAVDYLVSVQHPGTGGFGWWPGYVGSLSDTGYATRGLDALDRLDLAAGDGMADTLGDLQRPGGGITELDWDYSPRMDHTAHALLALTRVDQAEAIDEDAAASYIGDHQTDEGGFRHTESSYTDPSIRATDLAIRALDAVDELDRINRSAAVDWLADHQGEGGEISSKSAEDATAVKHTSVALRALSVLEALDAVDTDAAGQFLASWQAEDGTYLNTYVAGLAVNGLATVGDLTAIDTDGVQQQIADAQVPRGTTIPEAFYTDDDHVFRQHAVVVEAADHLGILSGPTGPCVDHPQPGDVPASLYLDADVDTLTLTRGESASIPLDLAQAAYRYDAATVSPTDTPHGVDVQEITRELAPLELPNPSLAVAANWTATTGATTLTLCAQDEGGGHGKAQLGLTVETPPEEKLALSAPDAVDIRPGQTDTAALTVTNTGDDIADLRLEAEDTSEVTVEPASDQLRLAPGQSETVTTEIAVPATCEVPDTVDVGLRAWGPGGGEATHTLTVNVTERPADQLSLATPERPEVPLGASTPIDVSVTNDASTYACVDAAVTDVPDPLEASIQPAQTLIEGGQTEDLALVVTTPDSLEDAKHELAIQVAGQTDTGDVIERSLNVTISDYPAPSLTVGDPVETNTGTATTTAIVGEPLRLSTRAADADGNVTDVRIHPRGVDEPAIDARPIDDRYLAEITYDEPGIREVVYVAEDDEGQRTIATQTVTVVANQPPTIGFADRLVNATSQHGALLELSAQAQDPEDRPIEDAAYGWTAPGSFATATQIGPEAFAQLPVGEHAVDLTVDDAQGATSTAQATVAVDDALQLEAHLTGNDTKGVHERPTLSVLAQRDNGAPIPSPVWINVTHADTGAPVSSVQADVAGPIGHVQLPYDVDGGVGGFNLAGEHVVTLATQADSRPAAPLGDLETATASLTYTIGTR